ncbi:TIR domain-containing protein [Dendronalium sp. ChiSLP03b]|uniref:TIR domain-containing protein n=1 Tax=Dendronalium sp. ChiSLP03b TaxID=3075381 RepID=UPI002AD597CA|nr:TIR domain-containing protein [Dendronalium sp. ChiSLP03b]MDZ8206345.1 TIR domain-containing protein [Dendronalium sp. ChiSLP03b]
METEVFLEQKDAAPLTRAMIQVLIQNNTASDRYSLLSNAGIDSALIGNLRLDSQPNVLAQALVAEFRRYRVDSRRLDYHPMVNLLAHLCEFAEIYRLSDEDFTLFSRLVREGQENFKALKNPRTVESTQDTDTVSVQTQQPNSTIERDRVFISYSRKDKAWLDRLQIMLKPLLRKQVISVWDDTRITAGSLWRDEINDALAAAKVAVLMVSADFLASDFIAEHELPPLLEAAKRGQLTLIWMYLSACDVPTEITTYQAAHNTSKPLKSLSSAEQDEVLVNICKEIEKAAKKPTN